MSDTRTNERPAAPEIDPSRQALLSAAYRQALRARFIADRLSDRKTRRRVKERVRYLEAAAAPLPMPARWYILEAARLVRAGDLAAAKDAFDAGIGTTIAPTTIAPTMIGSRSAHDRITSLARSDSRR